MYVLNYFIAARNHRTPITTYRRTYGLPLHRRDFSNTDFARSDNSSKFGPPLVDYAATYLNLPNF